MKALPLTDLEVVAVVVRAGDTDEGTPDFELEVFNSQLRESAGMDARVFAEGSKCDCCGQRLKYACEVVHRPTNEGFFIGRACASKIQDLQRQLGRVENVSVALAERIACNKRERDFAVTASDEVQKALQWAKGSAGSRLAQEFVEKLRRFGLLSEAQIACLVKMHREYLAKLAIAATGVKCPSGRVELSGTIVSLKDNPQPAPYGGGTVHHWKMVVDLGQGVRVWGTCPEKLAPIEHGDGAQRATVGAVVKLTATVTALDKDPLFGYFSRPSKAQLLSVAHQGT